jgi:DNA-binding NarL/FixJ family response regulator
MQIAPEFAVVLLDTYRDSLPEDLDQEVLLLIASGYTDEEIATRLHLPPESIESHVSSLLQKLERRVAA